MLFLRHGRKIPKLHSLSKFYMHIRVALGLYRKNLPVNHWHICVTFFLVRKGPLSCVCLFIGFIHGNTLWCICYYPFNLVVHACVCVCSSAAVMDWVKVASSTSCQPGHGSSANFCWVDVWPSYWHSDDQPQWELMLCVNRMGIYRCCCC